MDGPKNITANFAVNTYTVSISGMHGTVSVNGVSQALPYSGTFNYGDSVALTAVPDTGYHFVGWSGDANGTNASITVMVDGAKNITANFAINTYALNITGTNGSVVVNGTTQALPYSGTFNYGDSVTLAPAPDAHYHFTGWSGDLTGSGSPAPVFVDGPKAVAVGYAIDRFTLTLSGPQGAAFVNGTLQTLPFVGDLDYGTSVTLSPMPNTGYHFTGWSGDLTGSASPATVTMDGLKNITANFAINTYSVSISGTHGGVTVNGVVQSLPYSGTFNYGDSVALAAVPDTGYHFVGWSGDASGTDPSASVTVDGVKSITANFAISTYALSIAGAHGSVVVDGTTQALPYSGTFNYGDSVSLDVAPDPHYHFTGWSGDLTGVAAPTTLLIDGPKNVIAGYAVDQQTLNLTGTHGRVAVNGVTQVLPWSGSFDYSASVTLAAAPDGGYQFAGWSGDLSGSNSPTTITMDGDESAAATFTAHPDFTDTPSNFWAYGAIEALRRRGHRRRLLRRHLPARHYGHPRSNGRLHRPRPVQRGCERAPRPEHGLVPRRADGRTGPSTTLSTSGALA